MGLLLPEEPYTRVFSCRTVFLQLCVHSLFERIKQLEITNHNLRRRAGVVSRGGTPSSEAMRTPTRRDSTPTFDHAGTGGKSSED